MNNLLLHQYGLTVHLHKAGLFTENMQTETWKTYLKKLLGIILFWKRHLAHLV